MDFKQDESHQDILEMVHDFALNEVKPLAAEIDKTEEFPMENVKKMAEMGLLGIPFPEEYGGSDMDTLAYIQTVEELSKYCATTGVIVSAHTSLCCTPIYTFGSEEQKQKYLPKLCSGEWLGAFALTEPNAGTDASGQKTVAVDKGGSLGAERLQDFHHQRGRGGCVLRAGHDGQIQGQPGHFRLYCREGLQGILHRQAGG